MQLKPRLPVCPYEVSPSKCKYGWKIIQRAARRATKPHQLQVRPCRTKPHNTITLRTIRPTRLSHESPTYPAIACGLAAHAQSSPKTQSQSASASSTPVVPSAFPEFDDKIL